MPGRHQPEGLVTKESGPHASGLLRVNVKGAGATGLQRPEDRHHPGAQGKADSCDNWTQLFHRELAQAVVAVPK